MNVDGLVMVKESVFRWASKGFGLGGVVVAVAMERGGVIGLVVLVEELRSSRRTMPLMQ